MIGTEKQINWAEKIKNNFVALAEVDFEKLISKAKEAGRKPMLTLSYSPLDEMEYNKRVKEALSYERIQDDYVKINGNIIAKDCGDGRFMTDEGERYERLALLEIDDCKKVIEEIYDFGMVKTC